MKRIKSLVALFAVAAILFLLPNNTLTASAEEPITYAVKYVESLDEWRYQPATSVFDDSISHGPLNYLHGLLKDGDLIVVYNDADISPELDLGTKKLSNLTVVSSKEHLIVYSGGITDCYVLAGVSCSINCEVQNAYIYDSAICSIGGNVKNLTHYRGDDSTSKISCGGTVDHFHLVALDETYTYYHLYNFLAGAFEYVEGYITSEEGTFSDAAPAAPPQPSAPTTGNTSSGNTSSNDYDDVPKTGESNAALWLICAAVFCAAGSYGLRKKVN